MIPVSRSKKETEIEQEHRDIAKAAGWLVFKIMAASPNGFPDRLYVKDGRKVLIEWKKPGEPMTAQQVIRHRELIAHGWDEVYCAFSIKDANKILGIK